MWPDYWLLIGQECISGAGVSGTDMLTSLWISSSSYTRDIHSLSNRANLPLSRWTLCFHREMGIDLLFINFLSCLSSSRERCNSRDMSPEHFLSLKVVVVDARSPNLHLFWLEPYVITIRARVFQKQIFFGFRQGLFQSRDIRISSSIQEKQAQFVKTETSSQKLVWQTHIFGILVTWLQSSNYIPVLVTCAPVSVNYRYQGAHNTGAQSAKTPLNVETGNDLFCKHSWLAPRLLAIWEASVQPGPATLHIGQLHGCYQVFLI